MLYVDLAHLVSKIMSVRGPDRPKGGSGKIKQTKLRPTEATPQETLVAVAILWVTTAVESPRIQNVGWML